MAKLIVSADDNGMTKSIVDGIVHGHKGGIVTSTSIIVNAPHADYALRTTRENPTLSAGVHLNLNFGKPLNPPSEVPSLVDRDGSFYAVENPPTLEQPLEEKEFRVGVFNASLKRAKEDEVEKELEAQIARFLESGATLTHLDSNYGIDVDPRFLKLEIKLAKKYDVPLRLEKPENQRALKGKGVMTPDHYIGSEFFGKSNATKENLMKILRNLKDGVSVLGCHPAYVDEELKRASGYHVTRGQELEVLTSPEIKQLVKSLDIELIGYSDLKRDLRHKSI